MRRPQKLNHLIEWREAKKLSQEQLAEAIGTSKATISRLEGGQRGLSQKWLEKLAVALDCQPGQLLASPDAANRPTGPTVPLIDTVQASNWGLVADPYAKGDAAEWIV